MNYTKKYAEAFNFHKSHYPSEETKELINDGGFQCLHLVEYDII